MVNINFRRGDFACNFYDTGTYDSCTNYWKIQCKNICQWEKISYRMVFEIGTYYRQAIWGLMTGCYAHYCLFLYFSFWKIFGMCPYDLWKLKQKGVDCHSELIGNEANSNPSVTRFIRIQQTAKIHVHSCKNMAW